MKAWLTWLPIAIALLAIGVPETHSVGCWIIVGWIFIGLGIIVILGILFLRPWTNTPRLDNDDLENKFAQAMGNAETELQAILERLRDAQKNKEFSLNFWLPAGFRQAAADQLENRKLKSVRRALDDAYIACDRLTNRVRERTWNGPIPEQAPVELLHDDAVPDVIKKVETALEAIRQISVES